MRRSFVVPVLALALALGLAEPSPAAAEPLPPPVLVSGEVPDGADITDVSVMIDPTDDVLLDLEIGETAPPAYDATATTSVSGSHFEVRLDPSTVPQTHVTSDGVIFAMVTLALDGADPVTTVTSARAVADPTTGQTSWVDPGDSSAVRDIGRAAEDDGIVLDEREYASMFGGGDTPAGCSDRKLAERVRSVTIGTTYPVGGDKAAMTVTSSTGATYGTAWSIKSSGGSFGEFRAGEGKFTRSGWGFAWDGSARSRSYRKGVRYGKFIRSCVRGCNACYRFWKPLNETGGTGSNTGIPRPDWHHCQPINRGVWWRDNENGHNYTYGSAVKFANVIGIDLSISREYNSSQKLWYKATTDRRMCGNDNDPALASKMMMRFVR
jgi:hypothetical protein